MTNLRLALAQVNSVVGDLAGNARLIQAASQRAAEAGAHIVVFPELALSGYPPEDLLVKPNFAAACAGELAALARQLPPELIALVGAPLLRNGSLRNAAAILQHGGVQGVYAKMLLPNYGVFDEQRYFVPGDRPMLLDIGPFRLAIHICEDSWLPEQNPTRSLRDMGLDALLNLSASPYSRGKRSARESILRQTAEAVGAPLLYCNLVGGQDELVFDGESLVLKPGHPDILRAASFEEDMLLVDLEPCEKAEKDVPASLDRVLLRAPQTSPAPALPARAPRDLPECEEIYRALTLGLRDYVNKNGFQRVVVALSGGIDSALVAALAVDALGAERVAGVTMPSPYTSGETLGDAGLLAQRLGIEFHTLSITSVFESFLRELTPMWPGRAPDTTEENLQARIRGAFIMALSNKFGWLVLTTGNKSEMATGYCTLYGDMAGGFAVIKDVPKTLVFELCKWRNLGTNPPPIPPSIISRPPSAELRPNQKDSDSLPPYDLLDAILERYVERDCSIAEIIAEGFDEATTRRVVRLVDLNEYKRRQSPPGVKITPKAFGRDRRMPITNRYRG